MATGEGGVVRAMGRHEDLLESSDAYKQLVKRQLLQGGGAAE
jgi:ABC-type multidrug transport system fused ATPase/permease subunit